MAGIYIHIPFCRKACHYCNFHFSTSFKQITAISAAIAKEALLRHTYINEPVATIYFGGGTPSVLPVAEITSHLKTLHELFTVEANAEITLEANPDDITTEKLGAWKLAGINRLSIGVQSFFEADLLWMNRAHNAIQAHAAVEMAIQAGFNNITIDLIYGTPGLTDKNWEYNVQQAINLQVPHLSCYALTVEPKTALEKMIATKKMADTDPAQQSRQFDLLMKWTAKAGYEHYEISNFAKPGFRSRHNSSYWQGKPYLALGPSAHSFNGHSRQWNIANNTLYLQCIQQGIVPAEVELLTAIQQLNEYIMTALRTTEGINMGRIASIWGDDTARLIRQATEKYAGQELILMANDHIKLTNKGKSFADGIAADLFFIEKDT